MDVDALTNRMTKGKLTKTPSTQIRNYPKAAPTSTETKVLKGWLGFLSRSKGMLVDRYLSLRNSVGSQDISQLESFIETPHAETHLHLNPHLQLGTTSVNTRVTSFSLFLNALYRSPND
jgi:hypothetical protein